MDVKGRLELETRRRKDAKLWQESYSDSRPLAGMREREFGRIVFDGIRNLAS
jgi:hypothetical protein